MAESNNQELLAEIARLQAENKTLADARHARPPVSIKVSTKGAVSIYGLGRFPVTLYRGQMTTLLDKEKQIRAFMVANAAALKDKPEGYVTATVVVASTTVKS